MKEFILYFEVLNVTFKTQFSVLSVCILIFTEHILIHINSIQGLLALVIWNCHAEKKITHDCVLEHNVDSQNVLFIFFFKLDG